MSGADHRELAAIRLDDFQRAGCLLLVGQVFRLFEEWTNELLAYAVDELANPGAMRTSAAADALQLEQV